MVMSLSGDYTVKNREVELEVQVRAQTSVAMLVRTEMGEAWVPKSQISDWSGSEELDMTTTSIFVPEWMAVEKGLV